MKIKAIFVIFGLLSLAICGCGYQEGVIEPDRQSYLYFTGNTETAIFHIDGGNGILIEGNYYTDSQTGQKIHKEGRVLYEIIPGKHEILVKRNGTVVVKRLLMVNKGSTVEVHIP